MKKILFISLFILMNISSINLQAQPKNIPVPKTGQTAAAPLPIGDMTWALLLTGAVIGSSFIFVRKEKEEEKDNE